MEVKAAQSHGMMLAKKSFYKVYCFGVRSENISRVTESREAFSNSVFICGVSNEFKKELKK